VVSGEKHSIGRQSHTKNNAVTSQEKNNSQIIKKEAKEKQNRDHLTVIYYKFSKHESKGKVFKMRKKGYYDLTETEGY
jgi:hypothetical protein